MSRPPTSPRLGKPCGRRWTRCRSRRCGHSRPRARFESMPSIVESADGTRIGYESFGEGPPMLLVHGTSATRIRWAPVRDELGSRYTIHEMDRRGRGLSTAEADAYSLEREAEDVAA